MKIAVFSVVHAKAEPYIKEFLLSLSLQTKKDFEVFLINDGVEDLQLYLENFDFKVHIMEKTGTPTDLRKIGMEWMISEGIEEIVFSDSDDYFSENRVEVSHRLLAECDIVCNELFLVGKMISLPIPMFGSVFEDGMKVQREHIMHGNCMGLSNTALRVNVVPNEVISIPSGTIAFDWALFTLCIFKGAIGVFTKEATTYYRQYGENIASPLSFSEFQIMRGVRVKKEQYQLCAMFYKEYEQLSKKFSLLFSELSHDNFLKERYCQAVRSNISGVSLWWENIKLPEDLEL